MMINRILAFFGLATLLEAKKQFNDGVTHEREERRLSREKIEVDQLRCLMNKPIIGISNEWENPLIGTVIDIEFITKAKNPVPVIRCAVTGKDFVSLCKVMPFTMQRFEAVMKLTPYERWCLIDDQNEFEYRVGDPRKLPKLYSLEEYINVLRRKGFSGLSMSSEAYAKHFLPEQSQAILNS